MRVSAIGLLCLFLPAAAAAQEIGEGELWLHESVWGYYQQFKQDQDGAFFAVSTNGVSAGYSYCPGGFDCWPLEGKREAVQACESDHSDLPGTCYVFASANRVLWKGQVHVLTDAEFNARLYGPGTIDEALEGYVEHLAGRAEGVPAKLLPSRKVWQRKDFLFAPAALAPADDECRYAFEDLYMASAAPNLFLLDSDGRHCAYSTGFPAADEMQAFLGALAACQKLAGPAGRPCFVYAAGSELLPGRSKL